MIPRMLRYLKCLLFGCDEKTEHQKWLEKRLKDQEDKLEEIENEDTDIDDVLDRLNK